MNCINNNGYQRWFDNYKKHLERMYELISNNTNIKFDDFCKFVFQTDKNRNYWSMR